MQEATHNHHEGHGHNDLMFHGLTALSVVICLLIDYLFVPAFEVPYSAFLRGIGLSFIFFGIFTIRLCMPQIKAAMRKKILITTGLYSLTRNPAEGSWIFFLLPGFSLLICKPIMIVPVIFQAWLFLKLVPKEEAHLEKQFGEEYRKYKAKVSKLIPFAPETI